MVSNIKACVLWKAINVMFMFCLVRTWLHISCSICSNGHCSSRSQYPLSQQQHKSNKNVTECPKGSYNWSKQFQATRERIWTMAIRTLQSWQEILLHDTLLRANSFTAPFTWKTNFLDCRLFLELYFTIILCIYRVRVQKGHRLPGICQGSSKLLHKGQPIFPILCHKKSLSTNLVDRRFPIVLILIIFNLVRIQNRQAEYLLPVALCTLNSLWKAVTK